METLVSYLTPPKKGVKSTIFGEGEDCLSTSRPFFRIFNVNSAVLGVLPRTAGVKYVLLVFLIQLSIIPSLFAFDADTGVRPYLPQKKIPKKVKAVTLPGKWLIRGFQIWLSPQDGPVCRFRPTCSRYGKLAIEKYGILFGSIMTADRLIRDNPFHPPQEDWP
ncbi:MAG: membrane protein insertion efficiency factor YidD [Candidatus Hydrogenedentota bacterium]|nr:MAG: membrane protein insertion efficiency factor YidD [Candidatus Hydrogenedentota bacterium]